MPTVAIIQQYLKEWSAVHPKLEAALGEGLAKHDMKDYINCFESEVLSNTELSTLYFDFIRRLKGFIHNPTRIEADILRQYQLKDVVRFGSAYFFFKMKKVLRPVKRQNHRQQLSGKNQCSEAIEYMQTGILLDHAFGESRAVRCSNWGPHYIRSKTLDGNFTYFWTRLGTNWGYIGEERIRIDFVNECIDFDTLSYPYGLNHFVQELWWSFYVSTCVYIAYLDVDKQAATDNGSMQRQFAFFHEGFWHIGHEIWNSLSAADFFAQHGVNFDYVVGYNELCLHGDLQKVISPIATQFVLVSNVDELARYFAENPQVTAFMTRHDFISHDMSQHTLANLRVGKSDVIDMFDDGTAALTICFGIRCGNRECLNAFDLLESLIDEVSAHLDGGLLRIVLDGTQRQNQAGTHAYIAADDEAKLLERMHQELGSRPGVEMVDTAYLTYPESVKLVNLCDLFVTPWGAGLVKTCWVGRVPGVIYGNEFILGKNGDYDLYSSSYWVEKPGIIEYLPKEYITRDVYRSDEGKINDFEIDSIRFSKYIWSFISKNLIAKRQQKLLG